MRKKKKEPCLDATRWDPRAGACDSKSFVSLTGSELAGHVASPSVGQESQRARSYEALKKLLRDECTSKGQSRYPSMAFERWWLSARDHGGGGPDPLLPSQSEADQALLSDLERAGFSKQEASRVARRLASASAAAAGTLQTSGKQRREAVEVRTEDDEVLLFCKSAGARVRLSAFAFKKLKKLYEFYEAKERSFEEAALVLGLRYQALGGTGFQLALPASAWKVLQQDFAVQVHQLSLQSGTLQFMVLARRRRNASHHPSIAGAAQSPSCSRCSMARWHPCLIARFPNYCSAFPDCARPRASSRVLYTQSYCHQYICSFAAQTELHRRRDRLKPSAMVAPSRPAQSASSPPPFSVSLGKALPRQWRRTLGRAQRKPLTLPGA